MRSLLLSFILLSPNLTVPATSLAGEFQRLQAALDGGAVPSQIEVLREPAEEDWRSRVIVRIGEARYVADYFSADADLPDIRVVAIDRSRPQRQLLLHTPEPGTCIFHLLGHVGDELVPLLRFDSGPGCRAPQPHGNGYVSVFTWEGFWAREDRYRLSEDGRALLPEPVEIHSVEVAGIAARPIVLEGAECAAAVVQPGAYVKVQLYDSRQQRYQLRSADGACGWVPASELNSIDELVRDLPWAG